MELILILYILGAIPITWYMAYVFGYNRGYHDGQDQVEQRPAIDLELLASIPGLKIKGSGIDIDTSEMRVNK